EPTNASPVHGLLAPAAIGTRVSTAAWAAALLTGKRNANPAPISSIHSLLSTGDLRVCIRPPRSHIDRVAAVVIFTNASWTCSRDIGSQGHRRRAHVPIKEMSFLPLG